MATVRKSPRYVLSIVESAAFSIGMLDMQQIVEGQSLSTAVTYVQGQPLTPESNLNSVAINFWALMSGGAERAGSVQVGGVRLDSIVTVSHDEPNTEFDLTFDASSVTGLTGTEIIYFELSVSQPDPGDL